MASTKRIEELYIAKVTKIAQLVAIDEIETRT